MNIIHIIKTILFLALFGLNSCPTFELGKKLNETNSKKEIETVKSDSNTDSDNDLKKYLAKIDSTNTVLNWKKLKCGLYINKDNEIGFKFNMVVGISHNGYTTAYRTYLCCDEDSKPLKSIIDTTTFKHLGSTFYKDKRNIYHYYDMAGGGRFSIYEGVDYATFRVLGDSYAKDKDHIYGERAGILEKVDYRTFETLKGAGPYAKDKNGYYFWDDLIYTKQGLKDSIRLSTSSYAKDFYNLLKSKSLIK